ncbi:hypothetical protein B7R74_21645 [Yersinia pseudotuberculosis]|uniref:Uncharacterized protein n=1 Tax=Yersinia pseudotuberculosis TaxID=633 RepID=A0A380QCR7_YERPU|nr:hypothetical protein [Yersinia pseudotuberculosis]PSH11339.1 hypothetical protein B7R74_21645 [Yersinia pseudotuberculosis]SUP85802.1 Uncharacterised protein [Yersinia pseudotuberculosis]
MNITLPDWYDDLTELECKSKGCAINFNVVINGVDMLFNFYDITRFTQDAMDEIADSGYFKDVDAVILSEVTKNNIVIYLNLLS